GQISRWHFQYCSLFDRSYLQFCVEALKYSTNGILSNLVKIGDTKMGSPRIVLTASASEASEWKHSVWQQMVSATIPAKFQGKFIHQDALTCDSWPDGRAKYVPNGTRVVEALLLREYDESDVVTCYHQYLDKFVGPETKVVGIHAHNPLGISYATDVYSKLAGENLKPVNAAEFLKSVKHS